MDGPHLFRPEIPALDAARFQVPEPARLTGPVSRHPPRILLLHGSLRARSYSRFLADEAERVLIAVGCETRRFDPTGLPLPNAVEPSSPTQGRTLAVIQVSGSRQSFNAMRLLGRWMPMVTIPSRLSVPKTFELFDAAGRLPTGSHYERMVNICEKLVRFTWLIRDNATELVDRYSERIERAGKQDAPARRIAEARTG